MKTPTRQTPRSESLAMTHNVRQLSAATRREDAFQLGQWRRRPTPKLRSLFPRHRRRRRRENSQVALSIAIAISRARQVRKRGACAVERTTQAAIVRARRATC